MDPIRPGLEADYGFDLLRVGRAAEALSSFMAAAGCGRDDWSGLAALIGIGSSQADLGRVAAAREALAQCKELTRGLPGTWMERNERHLLGRIALREGRISDAIAELEKAASLLAPSTSLQDTSALVRYDLAAAKESLKMVVESGVRRLDEPAEYARSMFLLGEISEKQGNREEAIAW